MDIGLPFLFFQVFRFGMATFQVFIICWKCVTANPTNPYLFGIFVCGSFAGRADTLGPLGRHKAFWVKKGIGDTDAPESYKIGLGLLGFLTPA